MSQTTGQLQTKKDGQPLSRSFRRHLEIAQAPVASQACPAASAAPEPPEEPPAVEAKCQGDRDVGNSLRLDARP